MGVSAKPDLGSVMCRRAGFSGKREDAREGGSRERMSPLLLPSSSLLYYCTSPPQSPPITLASILFALAVNAVLASSTPPELIVFSPALCRSPPAGRLQLSPARQHSHATLLHAAVSRATSLLQSRVGPRYRQHWRSSLIRESTCPHFDDAAADRHRVADRLPLQPLPPHQRVL